MLVQPIALFAQTHEDAVVAVARASVKAWSTTTSTDKWDRWLDGSFTKTVRRVKSYGQFNQLITTAANDQLPFVTDLQPQAQAAAFTPTPNDELPRFLKCLQVQGTNYPHVGRWPQTDPANVTFVVNGGLGMSTGKTAAQVAHAAWLYALSLAGEPRRGWMVDPTFSVIEVNSSQFASLCHQADPQLCVVDNGLTEVPPQTCTVLLNPN